MRNGSHDGIIEGHAHYHCSIFDSSLRLMPACLSISRQPNNTAGKAHSLDTGVA